MGGVDKIFFEKVAETGEISPGQMITVKFGAEEVLVANIDGVFYALGNVCTHEGGKLSQGTLHGTTVTCPKHKAQFDIITGRVVSAPKMLFMHPKINNGIRYAVKVEGTAILLEHK